jgi:hypothetical protein
VLCHFGTPRLLRQPNFPIAACYISYSVPIGFR